jgi:gamma-glutamyltranspeptidase/glutathione hydrolase
MDRFDLRSLGHNSVPALHVTAEAGLKAFSDRYAFLSDPALAHDDKAPDMVVALLDDAYLNQVSSAIDPHGPRSVLPVPNFGRDRRERTTTTLATADEDGNALALTNTVMSSFGSAVLVPGTGIVLNNGMMWFDPRPGRPNSVGPAKRPLNNMSPLIVLRDNKPLMAVGAMGGRRIIGAVATIVSNVLDYGMGMQQACAAPRVDLSTTCVLADPRIPPDVLHELRSRGHDVTELEDTFGAFEYGSPAGIYIDQGRLHTGVDPLNPAAAAAF